MQDERIAAIGALRDEAWREVQATKAYSVVRALDEALSLLGGSRLLPQQSPSTVQVRTRVRSSDDSEIVRSKDRISQGAAAEAALVEATSPLPIGRLLEAALGKGAAIGGENPIANFRSALSRDERFYSFTRNGQYFWWLDGVDLPPNWNEAPDLPLERKSDASFVQSNREGGEAYATAT